jgi:transporter family-2 protein
MNGQQWPLYAVAMVAAGFGIPVLAALNSQLGVRIGSVTTAGTIGVGVAFLAASTMALASGPPRNVQWASVPAYYYLGGLFMAFYLVSVTWAAPRFGVGNAIFCVLLGQIVAAAAIDHFGLFSVPKASVGWLRLAGIALMLAGLYLARKPVTPAPL